MVGAPCWTRASITTLPAWAPSPSGAPSIPLYSHETYAKKRDHLNIVLKNTKDFMHAGRHVSKQGQRIGEFDVDRRDADFALAQTKIWLVYIARLLMGL
jgi:hypothetical protein